MISQTSLKVKIVGQRSRSQRSKTFSSLFLAYYQEIRSNVKVMKSRLKVTRVKVKGHDGKVKVIRSKFFLGRDYCKLRGAGGASTLGHFHYRL